MSFSISFNFLLSSLSINCLNYEAGYQLLVANSKALCGNHHQSINPEVISRHHLYHKTLEQAVESSLQFLHQQLYLLFQAYVDLVKAWGWKSFTIIYENNEGLVRLQELLKAHGPYEFPITVRQLGESSDYRYLHPVLLTPLYPNRYYLPATKFRAC